MHELTDEQTALWEEYISSWIDRHLLVYESEQVIQLLKRQGELWEKLNSLPIK